MEQHLKGHEWLSIGIAYITLCDAARNKQRFIGKYNILSIMIDVSRV